mmetsp:Transcript_425/g.572  ORF Transcript_425/g.572 Transcript_425/m.572 type:complete len:250 (+) Transcript_425:405-1154(+)
MLHSCTTPVINIFLNLTLSLSVGWFIDWELDFVILISYNNRTEGTVFSMDDRIINRPELMKTQNFLVIFCYCFHFSIWLIAHNMVNKLKTNRIRERSERIFFFYCNKSWKEWTIVIFAFDERVDSVAIGLDGGHNNFSELIRLLPRFFHNRGTICFGRFKNSSAIINSHCHIFYTISMFDNMFSKFPVIRVQWRSEAENNISLLNNMRNNITTASLKATISYPLKTKARDIKSGCLGCITNNKSAMMKG